MTALPAESRTGLARYGPRILWAIAGVFALLRFWSLDADPSGLLTPEFFTDEGWYSLNARNQALFGSWVLDEHNVSLVLCPLHTLALWASYSVWGVSFWSTRLVGALASALTIALIGWRLRRQPFAGSLAAALVATQPMLFANSRVAYCESLQLLFVTATWCFASDERRRSRSWVLAGVAAALAMCAKASALYAPMLALAAPFLWSAGETRSRRLREVGLVVLGGAFVVLACLPFEGRHLDLLSIESAREGSVLSVVPRGVLLPLVVGWTQGFAAHPGFWTGILPLLALAGTVGSRLLLTRPRDGASVAALRVAAGWIAFSLLLLFVRHLPALPERYWLNLFPPLVCLVVAGCLERTDRQTNPAWRTWAAAGLLAFAPALVLREVVLGILPPIDPASDHPLRSLWIPALLSLACLAAVLRVSKSSARLARMPRFAMLLAISVLAWSCVVSASVLRKPSFSIRDASRNLAADSPVRVLMGNVANTLALETPFRAFVRRDLAKMGMGTGWINGDWRALGATHGLTDHWVGEAREFEPPIDGAVLESSHPVWPDAAGRPRRVIRVWRLPDGAPR